MKKKYVSKSHVAVSVLTGNGNVHISFTPKTGGGSVYYTESEDIQKGLRSHPRYGKLFKEDDSEELLEAAKAKAAAEAEEMKKKAPKKTDSGMTKIEVACLDDAKDYLVDKFGISRTKLRTKTAIMDAAKKNKIEFTILG